MKVFDPKSASAGLVGHQVQQQAASICESDSRLEGMGGGRPELQLGRPGSICVPTSGHLGQGDGEVEGTALQADRVVRVDRPCLAQHALVLGSVPSWKVSLVLQQLTKAPFEPMQDASLNHLTFKMVSLLDLASGKRWSKIHAWLNKYVQFKDNYLKVALSPSANFISKNQLAKEGPDRVSTVVIPALAPTLERSLTSR